MLPLSCDSNTPRSWVAASHTFGAEAACSRSRIVTSGGPTKDQLAAPSAERYNPPSVPASRRPAWARSTLTLWVNFFDKPVLVSCQVSPPSLVAQMP
ncbi:hypothetical protein DCC62_26665 [candidate division KSB1 bacterium]|nr:MAG: hypothetical protein DCC62_26665 [candidate division KSB1 bacterium]